MAKRRGKKWFRGISLSGLAGLFSLLFRFFLKLLPPLAVAGLVAGLFFFIRENLYADPNLTVREIRVVPADALSNGVRADLEGRLLGKPILKADLKGISDRLQANPQIRRARVTRRLPSRLEVDIEIRKPAAYIALSPQGPYGLISEDGMILDVSQAYDGSMLLVEAYELGAGKPRAGYQIKNKHFLKAVRFLKEYAAQPMAAREGVSKVGIDASGCVTVTLGQGPQVKLGRDPASRLKALETARYLLDREDRGQIEYIDLQFEDMVVKKRGKR